MSLRAYQQAQKTTESPRDTEYRLFAQVTKSLIETKEKARQDPSFIRAIHWNKDLWGTLMVDCSSEDNQLPEDMRAGIMSLAIWVTKYSSEVMRDGANIDPLIHINRTIMEGLAQRAALQQ